MDERLLAIFQEEAIERLDRMSATLLAAESAGAEGEAVASLFRDVHSIKGSAGMFGFAEIGELAAGIEAVLEPARERESLDGAQVPVLLRAVDAIRAATEDDVDDVPGTLAALAAAAGPPAAEVPVAEPSPPPAGASPALARTLRVNADKVDRLLDTVGETALHRGRMEHLVGHGEGTAEELEEELERGHVLVAELQDAVLELRTLPLGTITGALGRAVRDVAVSTGRQVRLELRGEDTPLDRSILEGLSEILVHLLRNAVSHGIEPPAEREAAGKPDEGRIVISAAEREHRVAIVCGDDGRGVPAEVLARARAAGSLADLLAAPGFSTAEEVTELSGRGVGLDAVKRHVESLGGTLAIESTPGAGTEVTLLLPVTLAVGEVLVLERGGVRYGLPLTSVREVLHRERLHELGGRPAIETQGELVRLVDLADVLGAEAAALAESGPAVVVVSGGRAVAVACDALHGDQETIVKSMGPLLAGVPGYLGASVQGDGTIALLLDPAHLVRTGGDAAARPRTTPPVAPLAPKVLVVDDQFTVRELERTILEAAGYRVVTAGDGRAALAALDREGDVACVVSDVQMPGMDGLELLEQIRTQPARAALPVVIVTSREDERSRTRGADAGADAWVVKARFDQQALLDTVGGLLAGR